MKRLIAYVFAALACVTLFGCAHPITVNPDMAAIQAPAGAKIDKQVGYHIPDSLRALEITTPGGGGDKVRYFPYRDMEPGFYKALSEVFRSVNKISNPRDAAALKTSGITLLITPEMKTNSSSNSAITWPPTQFTLTLNCTVTDADGKLVKNISVTGDGRAEFSEFKANFSLSAVRAANDALTKLIRELGNSPELRR